MPTFYERIIKEKPDGMSDSKFAEAMGIDKGLLKVWKLNSDAGNINFIPTGDVLMRIAPVVGIDPLGFLNDDEEVS